MMPRKYHVYSGFLLVIFGGFIGYQFAGLHKWRNREYIELSNYIASHGSNIAFNMEQCNASAIRASSKFQTGASNASLNAFRNSTFNKSHVLKNQVVGRNISGVQTSEVVQTSIRTLHKSSGELLPCKHLWSKDGHSSWFDEKFNSSLKPIWASDNVNLSPEAFTWWNKLRKEESYQDVLALAKELGINNDVFLNDTPKDCIRCAVVGNSGNLRQSGYGEMIDSHNLVIRMNQCPVSGYEQDVGSKTTHYIAYPLSFQQKDLRNASLVLAAFSANDMRWLKNGLEGKKDEKTDLVKIDKNKVFLFNPELMWHIKNKWGIGEGAWPSTGIMSVFFALQICDEVNIYGFGANKMGYWDHYFEKNNGKANSAFQQTHAHDSSAESKLLEKLSDNGKVVFYKGSRT